MSHIQQRNIALITKGSKPALEIVSELKEIHDNITIFYFKSYSDFFEKFTDIHPKNPNFFEFIILDSTCDLSDIDHIEGGVFADVLNQAKELSWIMLYEEEKTKKVPLQVTQTFRPTIINFALPLNWQIHGVLKEVELKKELSNKNQSLENENHLIKTQCAELKQEIQNNIKTQHHLLAVEDYYDVLQEQLFNTGNFEQSLGLSLEEATFVKEWSLVSITQNGQKIFSPSLLFSKYQSMTPIYLSAKKTIKKITSEDLGLIKDLATQTIGDYLIYLPLLSERLVPEAYIILQVDEQSFAHMRFGQLQTIISYAYFIFKIKNSNDLYQDEVQKNLTLQNFIAKIAILNTSATGSQYKLVSVTYHDYVKDMILDQRFQIETFINDFMTTLSFQFKCHLTYNSFIGPFGLYFLTPKMSLGKLLDALDEISKNFSFWKYFFDQEKAIHQKYSLQVRVMDLDWSQLMKELSNKNLLGQKIALKSTRFNEQNV